MVGERIRYYRKRQKMTLRELGEKSGFENRGDVRIAQYENGSRVPRTGTLNRIAKALGIPPEELFCEDCRKCMFLKNYSVRTVESVCFSRIITERKENLIPLLIWESKKTTVTENTKIPRMKGFCMTI